MEKQKTAMQELIANAITAKEHSKDGYVTYEEVIAVATDLLAKEKEQIVYAHDNGYDAGLIETAYHGENYYNDTYNP